MSKTTPQDKTYLYQDDSVKVSQTNLGQLVNDVEKHIKDKEEFSYDKEILEKKKFYHYSKLYRKNKKNFLLCIKRSSSTFRRSIRNIKNIFNRIRLYYCQIKKTINKIQHVIRHSAFGYSRKISR